MSETMQGIRLADLDGSEHFPILQPGEYRRYAGVWYGCAPDGQMCGLAGHAVSEHDDGTITVSPSILITGTGKPAWHGYLERGMWREV